MAARIGALLIVGSFVFWAMIPVVPLVGLRGGRVGLAVVALMVAREIVFWVGVLLIGRESWVLARRHGWRRVPAALWRLVRHSRAAEPAFQRPDGVVSPDERAGGVDWSRQSRRSSPSRPGRRGIRTKPRRSG